ncbi:hypothetical protein HN51_052286 [Arachis hypogaea]
MYGSVRRAVDRNGLVVPHSRLQWGLLFFFLGESLRPGIFVHAINPSDQRLVVGGPAELSEKGSLLTPGSGTKSPKNPFFLIHSRGADTPARITGDGYKNGGEVNSTRRLSGMDVDPSGRDNHSGPGRGGDHSQELSRSLMSH